MSGTLLMVAIKVIIHPKISSFTDYDLILQWSYVVLDTSDFH